MIDWLIANVKWVFSGIGVFVISFILILLKGSKNKTNQIMKNSNDNIQAGGDVTISINKDK